MPLLHPISPSEFWSNKNNNVYNVLCCDIQENALKGTKYTAYYPRKYTLKKKKFLTQTLDSLWFNNHNFPYK